MFQYHRLLICFKAETIKAEQPLVIPVNYILVNGFCSIYDWSIFYPLCLWLEDLVVTNSYIFAGFHLQWEWVCHCYLREKSQYPVGVEPKTSGLRGLVLFLPTFLLDCTGWGQTWDLFCFVFSLKRRALDHLATAPPPKPTLKNRSCLIFLLSFHHIIPFFGLLCWHFSDRRWKAAISSFLLNKNPISSNQNGLCHFQQLIKSCHLSNQTFHPMELGPQWWQHLHC